MPIHFSLFFFGFLNCFSINLFYTQLVRTKQAGRSFPENTSFPMALSMLGYQPPDSGIPLSHSEGFC